MQHVIRHATLEANGARLHYARTGSGPPLVLLHGWPEFWLTWEPVMARLAGRFDLIAPDLRGFGDSPKPDEGPSDRAGPEVGLRLGVTGRPFRVVPRHPVPRRVRLQHMIAEALAPGQAVPCWSLIPPLVTSGPNVLGRAAQVRSGPAG